MASTHAQALIPARVPDGSLPPRLLLGLGVGLIAASIGAFYTVMARYGLQRGMAAADMTFLRFTVAGVIMLPLAMQLPRRVPGLWQRWRVWLAVSLLAGPPFGLLMFGALNFAPPSHAAVFPFAAMSVMGTIWAAVFLGDRLTARKLAGIAVVLVGLVVLSGIDVASLTPRALLGDAMFLVAGAMWAGFGIVMRRHGLNPWHATAVIAAVALVTYVPIYIVTTGLASLAAAPLRLVLLEGVVQGAVAGVGTLYTYSKMVALLGPSRAAIFPALAPGLAAVMAWPILHHVPTLPEFTGLALAMAGLIITVTARSAAANLRLPGQLASR